MLTVSLPSQWTFLSGNAQNISLGPFVDRDSISGVSPVYINDLNISCSIYSNRSLDDPITNPGTLIKSWAMLYIAYSNGMYRGTVDESFRPPTGLAYVFVIDAPRSPSGFQGHWEFPAVVQVRRS